jgi:hypothetical protein
LPNIFLRFPAPESAQEMLYKHAGAVFGQDQEKVCILGYFM